ncbi:MAG: ArnT family glycosyltransferase [Planctomycetaceae bacterium]
MKRNSTTRANSKTATGGLRAPRLALRELAAVGAVLVFGAILRCYHPERMAVEHFDEGVYASNVWSSPPDYRYPNQQFYAPPLFPALVELAMRLPPDLPGPPRPMLVGLVAGSLTILAVWWLGRCWFGPVAGVTAATLCAFSDVHLVYSRSALTDPLLCLWLVLAMVGIGEGHRRLNRVWLFAGGVMTGLAWWTKYNGWLPLAIQLSGLTAWLIFGGREARRRSSWHAGGVVVTAVTAVAVIFPMFLDLEGGYAAVAANHRGYLVGLSGWGESLSRQWGAHRHFDGTLAVFGVAYTVLLTAALCVGRREGRLAWVGLPGDGTSPGGSFVLGWIAIVAAALPVCGFVAWTGTSAAFAGLTTLALAVGLFGAFRSIGPSSAEAEDSANEPLSRARLPFWLLAAWFAGLFLATPMYRAYPRLTLPWLVSAWIGAGACCDWFLRRQVRSPGFLKSRGSRWPLLLSVVGVAAGCALLLQFSEQLRSGRIAGWQDRRGLRMMADEIVNRSIADVREPLPGLSPDGERTPQLVFYVYGEPGLYYHLSAKAQTSLPAFAVSAVQDLNLKPATLKGQDGELPTFLISGPHAHRSGQFQQQWTKDAARYRKVGDDIPYPASDLVLLNEFPASVVRSGDRRGKLKVRVYRVK